MRKSKELIRPIALAGATLLAGFFSSTIALADYPGTVLSQNPVGYYRLNETTPVVIVSNIATNRGQLGSVQNGAYGGDLAGRGAPGAIVGNTGASFDGVNEFVDIAPADAFTAPDFTVEFWFAIAGAGDTTAMMSCGEFGANRRGWLIYQTTPTDIQIRLYRGTGTAFTGVTVTNDFVPGQYYHMAFAAGGGTFNVYLDGVLQATSTPTVYGGPEAIDFFTLAVRSDLAFPWAGNLDEVAFYTNALSAGQVAAHYSAATTNAAGYAAQILAANPQVYYRLDEPALPTTENAGSLGHAADGNMIYPAVSGTPGPSSPAFPGFGAGNVGVSVSGSSLSTNAGGYVSVPPLDLNTNGVTITCWIKPNGAQAGLAGAVMFRSELEAPNVGTTAGLIFDQAGGLNLSYNWDGDDATYSWASGQGLADAAWNFAALIVKPDRAILYAPGANADPSINNHTHAILPFDGPVFFGTDPAKSGMNGVIDEVAIFDRALSIGEVYSQYADAVGGLQPRIFASPQSPAATLYAGDSLTLTVDAGGTSPLAYQWRKNGLPIGGETSASYTIANPVAGGPDTYDVVVTNSVNSATSVGASITVSPKISPIITQNILATNRTIYAGGAIKLSVTAEGGGIGYQWQKNDTDLPGQNSAGLTLNNIVATNAGSYKCVITNSAGTANSFVAVIAVASPAAGSYDAIVAADGPLTWWRLDDAAASANMLDAMGQFDGTWSGPVTLGATGALANNGNKAATFSAAAPAWGEVGALPPPAATGDFTFECWVRPTDGLTIESVPFSSFRPRYGLYFQKLGDGTWRSRDGYGDLDTGESRQGLFGPVATGQWTHLVVTYSAADGQRSFFNGRWDGNSYVDFCRNLNIPMRVGALDPLNLYGLQKWFTGDIDEVAVYGKALSSSQILSHYLTGLYSTNSQPVFAQQPQPQVAAIGSRASFPTLIEGSPVIGQQWYRNGSPIPDATNSTLTLPNVSYADAIGQTYQCVATNASGTTPSVVVTLTVTPQPVFVNLTNNLVLHLKFDGNYQDSSGHGHNATAVGSPSIVAGKVGSGALEFSTLVDDPSGHGANVTEANYLTLGLFPPGSDLSFSNNVNFSVAYWVKTATNATSGDLPIFASANNSFSNPGLAFAPSYDEGGWSWSLGDAATYAGEYGEAGTINDGNWHHLVHTFNRPTGQGITYLDGVQVSTLGISVLDNIDSGNAFNIGQDPTGGYPEAGTYSVDDLGVWKGRVLTPNEAYSAYAVGNNYGRSFDAVYPITIEFTQVNGSDYIVWQAGTLLWADDVGGTYTAVPGASAPYYQIAPTATKKFFRVQQ